MHQDPLRFKDLKRRVDQTRTSDLYGRTDQFAVAEHLEGLQEKFQVLGRDELADALRERLEELKQHRYPLLPEILSTLLQLSDRPALLSSVNQIEELKPSIPEHDQTLPDEDTTSGVAYCDEESIWEHVDFNAETSDDDLSLISSDVSGPKVIPQSPKEPEDEFIVPSEVFLPEESENAIACVTKAQFWRSENDTTFRKDGGDHSHFITELQIIRQTIFMLHGLPTSLFWRLNGDVEVDRRYALSHSPNSALASLLQSFSGIGAKLDVLRRFNSTTQSTPYMQTFHRGVEDCLQKFDTFLSKTETQYLCYQNSAMPNSTMSVSLLQLLEDVRRESRLLLSLADLVSELKQDGSQDPARCLCLLYELVCMAQATGADEETKFLAKLFLSCFETYTRPIRLWMEAGQLEPANGAFFVAENRKDGDLRTLFHDWFTLDESLVMKAPKFLYSVSQKIFTTGKSMFFLRQLGVPPDNMTCLNKATLTFEDLCPSGPSAPFCLPFSGLLETAFERLVDEKQAIISGALRNELNQQCGLWTAIEALELVYLCKDMSIMSPFDNKIFELIDRERGAWNDRFLLTEFAQNTFSDSPFVEPDRLIVRSHKGPYPGNGDRSMGILGTFSIEYILPWPVANIITKDAVHIYQRISTFLLQIRRARYVTLRLQLRSKDRKSAMARPDVHYALAYALRHNMLWFLNALYGHMTDVAISSTTNSMHKALSASEDVDAMIHTYRIYMSSMEDKLLLSKNVAPIHEAIINLLDLCIRFADIQRITHGSSNEDAANRYIRRRGSQGDESASEYEDQSDGDDDVHVENTTADISTEDNSYEQRLRDLKNEYDQELTFVTAGLKGVGRADGQNSWEMLAEKLEWRKGGRGVGMLS